MSNRTRRPLVIDAPAKINLHLEVLGKRPDGYHELESLMVTVSLADTITFEERPKETTFTCDDPLAGPDENNLVVRAVRLVREQSGREEGLAISLVKRTPIGAGLGGGSSDAAATLQGLNQWWSLGWSTERLMKLGEILGSDVPFFFRAPAAIVRGRGEIVTPTPMGAQLDVVLVTPKDRLSTGAVFGNLIPGGDKVPVEPIARSLERGDLGELATRLYNRLESAALPQCPALARIQESARSWPCIGHRMTGSGSTYFALCESKEQADSLGQHLTGMNLGSVFVVRAG